LSLVLCLTTAAVQAQSLRDRARQEGGKATREFDVDLPVTKLPELLSQSDLVVQARVVEARTHLGPAESYVVTDYVVAPTRVIKQNPPLATSRPGETTEIVVRRPGGRFIEGGLEMTTGVNIYPESESFKVGEDVVVFLQYQADARVYYFTGGP